MIHLWNPQLKPYWFPIRKNRVNKYLKSRYLSLLTLTFFFLSLFLDSDLIAKSLTLKRFLSCYFQKQCVQSNPSWSVEDNIQVKPYLSNFVIDHLHYKVFTKVGRNIKKRVRYCFLMYHHLVLGTLCLSVKSVIYIFIQQSFQTIMFSLDKLQVIMFQLLVISLTKKRHLPRICKRRGTLF